MQVLPNSSSDVSKKQQVEEMFDDIAPSYDQLNHLLSFQIDKRWRRKVSNLLASSKPKNILDIATGTADLAIELLRLHPEKIIGLDISAQMIAEGNKKLNKLGLQNKIILEKGDSEDLRFEDNSFDAITVAFGVRNFEHLEKGLSEIFRVLKRDKPFVILEFSKVKVFPIKQLYHFYFRYITPIIGKLVSKNESAYEYLPNSVQVFPEGEQMIVILKNIGFNHITCTRLSFGIASLYYCTK